jgi:dynein light intermediate chain 1
LPSASADYAVGAGVVGPMGSSSFSLPSVEKAMMEFEGESVDVGARLMGLRAGPPAAAAAAAASASPNTGRRVSVPQLVPKETSANYSIAICEGKWSCFSQHGREL